MLIYWKMSHMMSWEKIYCIVGVRKPQFNLYNVVTSYAWSIFPQQLSDKDSLDELFRTDYALPCLESFLEIQIPGPPH